MWFDSFYNEKDIFLREGGKYFKSSRRAACLKCWGPDTLFLFSAGVRLQGLLVPWKHSITPPSLHSLPLLSSTAVFAYLSSQDISFLWTFHFSFIIVPGL